MSTATKTRPTPIITHNTPRTRCLRHPLTGLPSIATGRNYWLDRATGRNVGLVLVFADGHTASLTYAEIHALERGNDEAVQLRKRPSIVCAQTATAVTIPSNQPKGKPLWRGTFTKS